MSSYFNIDWARRVDASSSPLWKRGLYRVARPALNALAQRHLQPGTVARLQPEFVFQQRGFPVEDRRRWALAGRDPRTLTILIQGTGTGWDVVTWARLRPRRIIATDLFAFPESWEPIAAYCREQFGVPVEFHSAPLEDHRFLADASIDLCASDAVLEHCRDLPSVLRESRRLLKPDGRFYASYGPLWFSAGGDHFSGRDGLQSVFNHVALDPDAFQAYYRSQLRPDEDFQSGGRYVELDLFSKLTTDEYLAAFEAAGFRREALVLEVSGDAVAFRRRYPERFAALERRWVGRCTTDDFLLSGHLVRLRVA